MGKCTQHANVICRLSHMLLYPMRCKLEGGKNQQHIKHKTASLCPVFVELVLLFFCSMLEIILIMIRMQVASRNINKRTYNLPDFCFFQRKKWWISVHRHETSCWGKKKHELKYISKNVAIWKKTAKLKWRLIFQVAVFFYCCSDTVLTVAGSSWVAISLALE